MLLVAGDEGGGGPAQRELAAVTVRARDDDAAAALADLDDRDRLLFAAEMPHVRPRADERLRSGRPHRGVAPSVTGLSGARSGIEGQDDAPARRPPPRGTPTRPVTLTIDA